MNTFRLLRSLALVLILGALPAIAADNAPPIEPALARAKIDYQWPDWAAVASPLAGAPEGWQHAVLTRLRVRSLAGEPCRIVHDGRQLDLATKTNQTVEFDGGLRSL